MNNGYLQGSVALFRSRGKRLLFQILSKVTRERGIFFVRCEARGIYLYLCRDVRRGPPTGVADQSPTSEIKSDLDLASPWPKSGGHVTLGDI